MKRKNVRLQKSLRVCFYHYKILIEIGLFDRDWHLLNKNIEGQESVLEVGVTDECDR